MDRAWRRSIMVGMISLMAAGCVTAQSAARTPPPTAAAGITVTPSSSDGCGCKKNAATPIPGTTQ